ncbi:MAG: NYN domain-containing protein [Candidatus Limnocylindrales bacterium]
MSKNVAVFVDVANIFYAAKAAGVDIDYVTLLKAASAGRDLVRAYAYTGLDPDNENQRQFHAFLARNGYSVVSKDIRKYGDGKVKANLDIELVVDLMRTARNLDIAVVVSGDGDFAPAIRAVQQTGVRVEVISFRGNTSSDLIDVADVFTDITQIARVERSSRSGRRVAAEEDLSMTEVPEKETEGASRRRRSWRGAGRDEPRHDERRGAPREHAAVAVPAVTSGGSTGIPLVVLPGEKLSKVAALAASPVSEAAGEEEPVAVAPEAALAGAAGESVDAQDASRHRRRRRGGRGRGRGRGQEVAAGSEPSSAGEEPETEELLEPEAPHVPQHSTFGSVWDSQLGMPTAPLAAASSLEEEDLEEPEIPEYLLAERRQRGRSSRSGGNRVVRGGRGTTYQQAVERERYGRGGSAPTTGNRPSRNQDRGTRPQYERSERARAPRVSQPEERGSSAEPWSEVPPEVAELLRAELARRGGEHAEQRPEREPNGTGPSVAATPVQADAGAAVPGPAGATAAAGAEVGARAATEPRGRTGRSRTRGSAAAVAPTPGADATPGLVESIAGRTEAGPSAAEAPAGEVGAPRRRTRAASTRAAAADAVGSAADALKPPATVRTRTRRASTAGATASAETGSGPEQAAGHAGTAAGNGEGSEGAPGEVAATARRGRRTTRAAAEAPAAGEPAAAGEPPAPSAPRRTRRSASAQES